MDSPSVLNVAATCLSFVDRVGLDIPRTKCIVPPKEPVFNPSRSEVFRASVTFFLITRSLSIGLPCK